MFLCADGPGELHPAGLLPTGCEPAADAPQLVLGPGGFPEGCQENNTSAGAPEGFRHAGVHHAVRPEGRTAATALTRSAWGG